MEPHEFTNDNGKVFILRTVPKNRTTHGGFIYPQGAGASVECPDWRPDTSCGGGLHGWPWGFGLGDGKDYDILEDIWLVLSADPKDVIGNVGGGWKCKCRAATIEFEGGFKEAWELIKNAQPRIIAEMAKPSGDASKLAASGNASKLAASGNASKLAASGDDSQLAASGDDSQLAASGDDSQLAASGYDSKLAASGDASKLAASGDASKLAASGNASKLAASGNASQLAASGDDSQLAASGDDSQLAASGYDSICVIAGERGRVKVGKRGAFAIPFWDAKTGWQILVGKEGKNGIKAGVWYEVKNGKIVEA